MRLSATALLPPLLMVLAACGDTSGSTSAADTSTPAPTEITVETRVEGVALLAGAAWLGPAGARLELRTTGPVATVALVLRTPGGERVVDEDGAAPWRLQLDPVAAGLADGQEVTLTVRARAQDGVEATTTPLAARVDLAPPALTAPALPGAGPERDTFRFELVDAGVGADPFGTPIDVTWRGPLGETHRLVEGTDFLRVGDGAEALEVVVAAPAEGRYTIALAATDLLGNAADSTAWSYTTDASPPTLQVDAPTDGDVLSDVAAIEAWAVDALLPGSVTLSARLVDATGAQVSSTAGALTIDTRSLADGEARLEVRASDGLGNTTAVTRAVIIDNHPPRVAVVAPVSGSWVRGEVAVTATATDDGVGLARVDARVDHDPVSVSATASADGGGAHTLVLALPDGAHTVWVDAVDRLGRAATASVLVAADTTPPDVTLSPAVADAPTRTFPTWKLTATDDGAGVDLAATADTAHLRAASGEPLALTAEPTPVGLTFGADATASGPYTLEVQGVDVLGNAAEVVAGTWWIDRDAPGVAFPVDAETIWSGVVDATWTTWDDDQVASSWLDVEDAAALHLAVAGDAPAWHAVVDSTALADGLARAAITAVDRAGNSGELGAWVLVDNTAPAVVVSSPLDGRHAAPRFVLRALVHEGTSGAVGCEVREAEDDMPLAAMSFPGRPTGATSCALPIVIAREGLHPLTVRAWDAAGLVGEATVSLWIDGGVPTATAVPAGGVVTELPGVTITIADGSGGDPEGAGPDLAASADTLAVTHDGADVGGWAATLDDDARSVTVTWPPDATDGRWEVALSPRDRVGNVGEEVSASFLLDTSPPEVTAVTPLQDAVLSGAVEIEVEVFDPGGVAEVTVTLVDRTGGSLEGRPGAPPWRTTLDTTALADGPATLILAASDEVSHTGTRAVPVMIDNDPPELAVLAPTHDALVGGAFDLTAVVRDDGAGVASVVVSTEDGAPIGTATLDPPSHDREVAIAVRVDSGGERSLAVVATDGVGRSAELVRVVAVDAVPPTLTAKPAAGATLGSEARVSLLVEDGDGPFSAGVDMDATLSSLRVTVDGEGFTGYTASVDEGRLDVSIAEGADGALALALSPADVVGNAAGERVLDYTLDRTAPKVASHAPGAGAHDVPPTTDIVFVFDEAMDPLTLPGAIRVTADGAPLSGHISVEASSRTLRFTPDFPFAPLTQVEVELSGTATDTVGNPLGEELELEFTVAAYRFRDVAIEAGVGAYRGGTGEIGEDHGPGGTFADVSGDGYPDLVLGTDDSAPLRYYVNVAAPGTPTGRRFEARPLVDDRRPATTGIIAGDYDNDGDLDLYVTNFHEPNLLLQNQLMEVGSPDFVDVTPATAPAGGDPAQVGVGVGIWPGHKELTLSMTAAWADVNRDGLLDLYVGNHNGHYPSPDYGLKAGERDVLYLNQGDRTFRDVTDEAHAQGWESANGGFVTAVQEYSSTNAVIFTDLNDDRWPDLIVTNKLRHPDDRDMIYVNRGTAPDGSWLGFHPITYELTPTFGTTNPLAMGIAAGDVDRDGDLDFYVTDWAPYGMVPGPNELWINQFVELGELRFEIAPCCHGVYSWGVQLADLDNDGQLEIHVTTNSGYADLLYAFVPGGPPHAWLNVASSWGVAQSASARGDMAADIDRDGWMDLFVVNLSVAPRLYRNFSARVVGPRRWLSVYLVGAPELAGPYRSTRDAIGARVYVAADLDGDGVVERQLAEIVSGSSNAASTSSLEAEFGLGHATQANVEVVWPSGRVTSLHDVPADQHLVVHESDLAP